MEENSTDKQKIFDEIIRIHQEHDKLRKQGERETRSVIITSIVPYIVVTGILLISFFLWMFNTTDPIDDRSDKAQRIIENVVVNDSMEYGFRVVFVTTDRVSEDRALEIGERPHIRSAFWKLREEAPLRFGGSLKEVDIYDFADYALNYNTDKDIYIHNIFASGFKMDMYVGPNPKIPNSATYIDDKTEQGNLYINRSDIYSRDSFRGNIYRYWKCTGTNATSTSEERFSHFSEDERIK